MGEPWPENTEIQTLLGGEIGWIGLQDFLVEGTFSWADGEVLGSYTNWATNTNQPDNAGVGQVRYSCVIYEQPVHFTFCV